MPLRLIADKDKRVANWVSAKLGGQGWHGACTSIGVEKDGVIVGGMVVDSWLPGVRCQIHIAGEGEVWLNRSILQEAFNWLFNDLDCAVVLAFVDASNQRSVRMTKHAGFKSVGVVPNAAPGGDLILFALAKADCRWI